MSEEQTPFEEPEVSEEQRSEDVNAEISEEVKAEAQEEQIVIDPFDPFAIPTGVENILAETLEQEAAKRKNRQAERRAARAEAESEEDGVVTKRRRRRRRGEEDLELVGGSDEDPPNTITRVRGPRQLAEGTGAEHVTAVKGSTRLEAKRQRRRESRDSGRRRHIITEAEFLARRESVERQMVIREREDRIQIGVMEDGILAEHFVSNTTQDSIIGNVYLGKVQNVLPSMEAAFVDIGRGRNAVLYAGEVNWDAVKLEGKSRRIESVLKAGDSVLVQASKDPVGHKGARLTSQISLPGRYLVYVPDGSMTGISRKLPDVERTRLKRILKDHLPEDAGVIVRTAAEGASEEELMNDINRLRVQWEGIKEKSTSTKTLAPELLYAEPDLTIKVVRDVFNEDFSKLIVSGDKTWDQIEAYVTYVAPDLVSRLERWEQDEDLFAHLRIDEQINKALDRKVYLPSGGSLVIDRTEAMTVVDVNTGKFTGSGGNLEETVTKNNLEAAEEVVRQLRLRDIGGIIVIDFIDMVLESNRDLVLRRLVECLGRDRTKHQVAEVTSLGLVQMTRKRMGTGLLEVFGEQCSECAGRGMITHEEPIMHRRSLGPVPVQASKAEHPRSTRAERRRNRRQRLQEAHAQENVQPSNAPEEDEAAVKRREQSARAAASIHAAASGNRLEPGSLAPKPEQKDSVGDIAHIDFGDEKVSLPTGADAGEGSSADSSASQAFAGAEGSETRGAQSLAELEQAFSGHPMVETEQKRNDSGSSEGSRSRGSRRRGPRRRSGEHRVDSSPQVQESEPQATQPVAQAESKTQPEPKTQPARKKRRVARSAQGESSVQVAERASSSGSSFTASVSSAEPSKKSKESSDAPLMLGVGVSAENITRAGRAPRD